jgi:AraC-like DNA-binding protein
MAPLFGGRMRRTKPLSEIMKPTPSVTRDTLSASEPLSGSELIERIRRLSPEWADRLISATTQQDLQELVSSFLQDLQLIDERVGPPDHTEPPSSPSPDTAQAIHRFLTANLHCGLSLKDLAKFLGYSEKYCSDLFQSIMGEPFSLCVKRLRIERATQLLRHTDSSQTKIAAHLGFSDQFAFSHFFKKAVGCSPTEFRNRAPTTSRKTRERT